MKMATSVAGLSLEHKIGESCPIQLCSLICRKPKKVEERHTLWGPKFFTEQAIRISLEAGAVIFSIGSANSGSSAEIYFKNIIQCK